MDSNTDFNNNNNKFRIVSNYSPQGDQGNAIKQLSDRNKK